MNKEADTESSVNDLDGFPTDFQTDLSLGDRDSVSFFLSNGYVRSFITTLSHFFKSWNVIHAPLLPVVPEIESCAAVRGLY